MLDRTPAKPLKLGFLIDSLVTGGAERLVVSFAEATLDRPEFDLTVFTLNDADTPFRQEIEALGIPVVALPGRSLIDPGRLFRLERALAQHDIEVLHAHLSSSIILGSLVAFLRRIPFVATVHNVKPSTRRVRALRKRLYDFALKSRRTVRIAVGEQVAKAAREDCPRDFIVLPNAVPPSVTWVENDRDAARNDMGFEAGHFGMLAIGAVIDQKGYPDLIDAFADVARSHPQARLAIVGSFVWQDVASDLKSRVQALDLEDRIQFLGLRRDVSRLLAGADLFVSASHWEGAPVSLIEAMANGCPCVVTDVGDNRVTLETTGSPVKPPHAPQELGREMAQLIDDPERCAQISSAVRQRANTEFGTTLWLDRLWTIYTGQTPRNITEDDTVPEYAV